MKKLVRNSLVQKYIDMSPSTVLPHPVSRPDPGDGDLWLEGVIEMLVLVIVMTTLTVKCAVSR